MNKLKIVQGGSPGSVAIFLNGHLIERALSVSMEINVDRSSVTLVLPCEVETEMSGLIATKGESDDGRFALDLRSGQ